MNEVLSVLFKTIPGILYEPVACCTVVGLILAVWMCRENRHTFFWLIVCSLFFMVGWRCGIRITSNRYGAVLIYPAVIAAAYCFFQMEWLARYIPRFPERFRRFVPYVLILTMIIIELAQYFHYNPYGDYILRTSDLIRNDAKDRSNPYILTVDQEVNRYAHYTGLPAAGILYDQLPEEMYLKNIGIRVTQGPPCFADSIYLVLTESTKKENDYYLQKIPAVLRNKLCLLGEFYHNRKKRRVTRVYRYSLKEYLAFDFKPSPGEKKVEKVFAHHKFSFDSCYPPSHAFYGQLTGYFKDRSWLQQPRLKDFPTGWLLAGSIGYAAGSNAELGTEKGSTGKRVFRLKTEKPVIVYTGQMVPAKDWQVRMVVSGKKDTQFSYGVHCYNMLGEYIGYQLLPAGKFVTDGKNYEYRCTIPSDFYFADAYRIRPSIYLEQGELFVHSIELYSVKK